MYSFCIVSIVILCCEKKCGNLVGDVVKKIKELIRGMEGHYGLVLFEQKLNRIGDQ